ncbi:hypothetical protein LJ753_16700 [Arthrobacter sp. zg-Y20]|uniref:hypothetical protein n=1 Tax=unclassified Arthrobacter TaxID=235627 RepID=UPI001D146982|nr:MULTISPECIES: hypothetical protein [unclassified Arthrobacter]MCC3277505.1 hypothetical protein [Arthrobacter sp. zg-Y20]MDK1317665.1 hypothetical protein [Arthrobacter sp. zg.Y20]WIB07075.1 hypothetical protein QNO06_04925 [Arthrobacter sp. zg-Y20]
MAPFTEDGPLIIELCDRVDHLEHDQDRTLAALADMGDYQDDEDPAESLARGLEAKRIAGKRRRAA